ncbi:MAG TPA: transposase [Myxococcota bacterium]|nr:transposase [Myxococcota bacterium]
MPFVPPPGRASTNAWPSRRSGRRPSQARRCGWIPRETNIHWPTDSTLLWDGYRLLGRGIEQARKFDPDLVGSGRLHPRRAKREALAITRQAARRGGDAQALKPLYRRLLGRVEGLCGWALRIAKDLNERIASGRYDAWEHAVAEALVQEITRTHELVRRVADQARRRVLQGESVPNHKKLFSLFEPHTELLKRGKAGKEIEFGHMVQIQQVPGKFITDYEVFAHKPTEHALLAPALASHRALFGSLPAQLTADKGYYESMERIRELEQRIPVVSIAKKGMRTAQETARESDPLFRHAQAFRAGVEGTISFLKRVLRLGRCFNKGWEHFVATVGMTIFAHNLLVLARH